MSLICIYDVSVSLNVHSHSPCSGQLTLALCLFRYCYCNFKLLLMLWSGYVRIWECLAPLSSLMYSPQFYATGENLRELQTSERPRGMFRWDIILWTRTFDFYATECDRLCWQYEGVKTKCVLKPPRQICDFRSNEWNTSLTSMNYNIILWDGEMIMQFNIF